MSMRSIPPSTPNKKMRFAGYTYFFLFLLQDVDEAVVTCTHNQCFEQKNIKIFFRREPSKLSIDLISLALFHWTNYGSYVN